MNLRFALLLALPVLTSCATKYDHLRNYDKPDAGTAVVSLGHASDNTMNYSNIWFQARGSEHLGYFAYSPKILVGPSPKDFTSERGESTLIAKKLPPGEYEITGFSTGSDYGTSVVTFHNPAPVAIRFSIRPGEVSYLGQYLVGLRTVQADGKNRPVSARLEISNEQARDMAGSKSVAPLAGKATSFLPGAPLPLGVTVTQ